jgi:hypothetical protein
MRWVVLDSNGVDPLVDLPGAFGLVKGAIEAGRLELLSTHVLAEEISATPDPVRRAKLQALVDLARMVPSGAFILDRSPLGLARLSEAAPVHALQAGNPAKNTNDALIGMTGLAEHCAVITSDKKLRREAQALGIEVLYAEELLAELGYTGPQTEASVPATCQKGDETKDIGRQPDDEQTSSHQESSS